MNNSKKARIRQGKIREMLVKKDVVTLKEFCDTLEVSVATIRNDLTYLEKQGVLKRVLGGAISIEGTPTNMVYHTRINLYKEEKKQIAKYAVDTYVKEGMCIALDAGSTCQFLAQYLLEKEISCKVLTNAFNVVSLLSKSELVEVYSAGGKLDKAHNSYHDETAVLSMQNLKSDVYFLSPNGICANSGITSTAENENAMKRLMMKNAQKTIVLADSSKFEREASILLAEFNEVESIITNKEVNLDKKYPCKIEKV